VIKSVSNGTNEEDMKVKNVDQFTAKSVGETVEILIDPEVQQEFENAEDRGESDLDQLKAELGEEHYTLPSPTISEEDAVFTNINPDQQGEAFGLAYQANEPLDTVEKIDERDEERWELNPASADDFDETNKEIEGSK
jgi:Family of unknown function (DUF6335)